MKPVPKLLSKTRLMKGFRCLKNIYLNIQSPELEAKVTPELQSLFDQGNAVGAEARKYFPGGTLIENVPWDFIGSLKKTRELIAAGVEIIYEAAFDHQGCYARVDVLRYSKETKRWSMFEVKSSTKVKPEHIDDIGVQAWIVANSGIPLETINLMHLNSDCRYPNLENLFTQVDVTQKLRDKYSTFGPRLKEIFETIKKEKVPDIDIGSYCTSPTECGFKEHCWKAKTIPEISVFDLPKINDRKWEFYKKGIIELTDNRLSDLLPNQERMVEVHKTGKRFVDAPKIKEALSTWRFPLIFLDFETINPAIPRYDGTGPFFQVPFQYSAHALDSIDSKLKHSEYLHEDNSDPRPPLIPKLLESCAGEGSIVSYFARFETDRIQEMADQFPEYKEPLEALLPRFVDPLTVIRDNVYDIGFKGSFSLKEVAPAILGKDASYAGMKVSDGGAAQRAFEELISDKTLDEEKRKIKIGMLEYCRKDTLVMVELVNWLFSMQDQK